MISNYHAAPARANHFVAAGAVMAYRYGRFVVAWRSRGRRDSPATDEEEDEGKGKKIDGDGRADLTRALRALAPPLEWNLCCEPGMLPFVLARVGRSRAGDGSGRRSRAFETMALSRASWEARKEETRAAPGLLPARARVQRVTTGDPRQLETPAARPGTSYVLARGAEILARASVPNVVVSSRFRFGIVRGVATPPVHRRRGHTRGLMAFLLDDAFTAHPDRAPLDWLFLWVDAQNAGARALYETLGFASHGRWAGAEVLGMFEEGLVRLADKTSR